MASASRGFMMFRLAVAVSGPRSFSRYRSCATIMSTPRTDAATDQSPLWRWRHPFRRIESDQKVRDYYIVPALLHIIYRIKNIYNNNKISH